MSGKEVVLYVDAAGIQLYATDGEPPEGGIPVNQFPAYADQLWLFPGWGPSPSQARKVEDEWRTIEMPIARENVTAIEFGDDSIPGTTADWKAYWLALRGWDEGADGYPDSTHRPVEPT